MRDTVSIRARGGRGGDGSASFRREKYVPRGGPDGGDGGRGGHVIIAAHDKVNSLRDIKPGTVFRAPSGGAGGKSGKYGRAGADLVVRVPAGTSVLDAETGELLADLAANGDKIIVSAGGSGGRGNMHFATPKNRVPLEFEPGGESEERALSLEYSIPSETAVIGLPGAGKSTLVRALTGSRTPVGEYDFTTRKPYIGVCGAGEFASFRMLDMPALADGSSEGRGVGNFFLRHLRRVELIVLLIDSRPGAPEPEAQVETLLRELAAYDPEYLEKKRLVVYNRRDAESAPEGADLDIEIDAARGDGLEGLRAAISQSLGLTEDVEN